MIEGIRSAFATPREKSTSYQILAPERNAPLRNKLSLLVPYFVQLALFCLALWGLVSLGLQVGWQSLSCFCTKPSVSHADYGAHNSLNPQAVASAQPDVYRPDTLAEGVTLCDCGSSVREALSRECVYDALSAGWLPPYCRDAELTAQFEAAGPEPDGRWTYYADGQGQETLDAAQLGLLADGGGGGGKTTFWATREWHIQHCLFYWRKHHRMRHTGAVMEARFDTDEHVRHCLFYWRKHHRMRHTGAVMEARFDTDEHVRHCLSLIGNTPPDYFFLLEVPVRLNSTADTVI
ncbi:hypothetical protein PG991_009170 [Apiospora marii]|uniref:Uncharacterized protein n=1 Tax=Apiospora marii TaxID=335849 RepID=A0ABR1RJW9_9PEZI